MFLRLLPKKKIFIDYVKAKTEKVNKELLEIIAKHYEVSIDNAKMFYFRMGKHEATNLLTKLGYDSKQITKLLK
jgi:septum formation topological specificity factor MinE